MRPRSRLPLGSRFTAVVAVGDNVPRWAQCCCTGTAPESPVLSRLGADELGPGFFKCIPGPGCPSGLRRPGCLSEIRNGLL